MATLGLEIAVGVGLAVAVFVAGALVVWAMRRSAAAWICTYLDYHPDRWVDRCGTLFGADGEFTYGTCRRCGARVARPWGAASRDEWARVVCRRG